MSDPIGLVEDLYQQYHREIVQFFSEHLSDREMCWDLCHDVFLRLLLTQAAGTKLKKPRGWLMRVASNLLIDTYRQRAVTTNHQVALSDELAAKLIDAKEFWTLVQRQDLVQTITNTFQTLPRKTRLLLYWREIEGISVKEIAMRTRTTEAVISTELWRARKQFQREYLRQHFKGVLERDEELFEQVNMGALADIDPLGTPEEQVKAIALRVQHYFDKKAPSWDSYVHSAYEVKLAEQLATLLPWNQDMRVLDVGTGTGYLAQMIAPQVGQVIGVDHSQGMLQCAGEKAAAAGLQQIILCEGAAENLPVETGSVDVAMCHMLLHHVVSPQAALREMRRVVRPGGYLLIIDADRHQHPWTLKEFGDVHYGTDRKRLQQRLKEMDTEVLEVRDAGISHSGITVGKSADFSNFLVICKIPC